ncbi:helix-turn-helix transcriptional regulator [Sediminitomix flava]|uniref:Putative DNA-binding transcriptional regulator YafY n=1 Tax=Sediminitomix flava TaxID=379075 RepID=A0A315ZFB4_SEDFL|nr:WYL domain-containing protein [Sediminitomix flava]PWJ43863.1 putative DNA-binding transcriptional regulator YafY [Sediminitomix flava]
MTRDKKQIFRIIRMIQDLSRSEYTRKELEKRYGVGKTQIHNDFLTIEKLLYPECIQSRTMSGSRAFLYSIDDKYKLNINTFLSREEEKVLLSAVHQLEQEEVYHSIKRKLKQFSTQIWTQITTDLDKENKIAFAVTKGYCISLRDYEAPSTNTIEDYEIEPIKLFDGGRRLYAYDLKSKQLLDFKLTRAGAVEITKQEIKHQHLYQDRFHDAFGWSCEIGKEIPIQFEMDRLAGRMIQENYPDVKITSIHRIDGVFIYQYKGKVANYKGVGRFVLSLPSHIRNIQPQSLRDYLLDQMGKYLV